MNKYLQVGSLKNNMRFICFLLLGIVIICSCKKNDRSIPDDLDLPCDRFIPTPFWGSTVFVKKRFQYQKPFFNPNDPNEFIYVYKDLELNENKLMKYNVSSGSKSIIMDQFNLVTQPNWSQNGWICFDSFPDYHLWKIKENGDSLEQITEIITNLNPALNASGDRVVCQFSEVLGVPYFTISYDIYSNDKDTLRSGFSKHHKVSQDNNLLFSAIFDGSEGIAYTNIDNISFDILVDFDTYNIQFINGMAWHPNGQDFYFTSNNKCYKCNIYTKEVKVLFPFCNGVYYKDLTCSSDGTKLLGERVFNYPIYEEDGSFYGKLAEQTNIAYFDLNTCEEVIINLE